ncbi:MAG: GNAT family N-acetyltransferase [Dinoroseobacter sp.]|nr:GNAT family N-acetyltransferase [Dinoroseobacter sp.]
MKAPDTLTVRASTRADIAAIDALLARSYPILLKPDYAPSVLVTALPLISRAQPALITCGTYYVAEREGLIIGAGGWTKTGPDSGRPNSNTGQIRHLITDHRVTRQGVASTLIRYALAQVRSAGIHHMVCQSTRTAVPFYEAMGFKVRGAIDVPLRPGISFPAVAMERSLK